MPLTAAPVATSFSGALRARTAAVHAEAESMPFLLALAQGRVTQAGVVGLLQRLVPVYDSLEQVGLGWSADADIAPLLVPGLERSGRLRADLTALDAAPVTTSPAALAYGRRILEVATTSAPAYLAHHYTRYLGDLSGGQIINHALTTQLGLELSFFSFPDLRGPAVKRDYRAHLDGLTWSATQQEEAVTEAEIAFRANQELAAELADQVLA